jgi:hypothetical protein
MGKFFFICGCTQKYDYVKIKINVEKKTETKINKCRL